MKAVWLVALLAVPLSLQAQQALQQAQQESRELTAEAVATQQRIDNLDDAARAALEEYTQAQDQALALNEYSERLQLMVEAQAQELTSLQQQIDSLADTQREMLPLIRRMIESLEAFVALDMPFLLDERRDRIARLHANQSRSDLSSAEKFRQVLEAYKIESEYGARIDSHTDTVMVDGKPREVILLRVGRIALIYQTPDQQITAAWDQRSRSWQVLDSGDYRSAVAEGIRIARKRAAVDMLQLPIPSPEVVQ